MKSNRLSNAASGTQFRRKAVAFGVAMAIASPSYANPTGMSVAAGQATAQTIGNLMQITNTPGAILNWQQFNIDAGQTTQFIQQNAASQVFNRVTGGEVSQILGNLQSNGQVFLINPAGVFFGQGAVIDTAGFLASTLAASDIDLLNGHLRFNDANGTAGGIVNQGTLTTHSGGSIVLLAPSIENSGIIHADGEVLLAAGHSVTIVDMKHPTIGLSVTVKDGDKAVNLGQIISKNASLFSHLVKNSGVVEATGAQVDQGGVIRFIAQGDALVGGQVLAESESGTGGEIDITGRRVAVLDGARVSADGAAGGGTVHIGGGWQGQDETLANAQQTVVQANTHISANATANGNGGEVVVWADGHTVVDSEVQAKGGTLGGNGGRIETSGKESLAVNVAANTSAPNGEAGQWLIDPANLTIVDQIPEGGFNLENSSQSPFFSTDDISSTFSPTESYLLASTVVSGLESNGFVQIYTTGIQPGDGNLTFSAPVLIDQNLSSIAGVTPELFLQAKGEINIDAAIGLQPGQTAFDGFNLFVSYDIAKPVYVDAPLYLGNSGSLILAPYEVIGGSVLPTNTVGQLPLDGVNLLSGMNGTGTSGPLVLNRIVVSSAVALDPSTEATLFVGPDKPVKLNVLGASLAINEINAFGGTSIPETDIRVGLDDFDLLTPVQGNLSYNSLTARSLTVDAGSAVSSYSRIFPGQTFESTPYLSVNRLVSSGTINFNAGFADIFELNANAGTINFGESTGSSSSGFFLVQNLAATSASTLNLIGAGMQYGQGTLNGTFNVVTNAFGGSAFLDGVDTNLNGSLNIGSGFNNVNLQSLGMGSTSQIRIGSSAYLGLGRAFASSVGIVPIEPKQTGAYISSTNGQFVAQQGARIIMDGSASSEEVFLQPAQFLEVAPSSASSGGATLDITGLDGRLDAPVIVESNGYFNLIGTNSSNFNFASEVSIATPISTMVVEAADIRVNAGGDGKALRIGGFQSSESPSSDFGSLVDLDFNGTLTVNSGRVRLAGANLSTTGGALSVNGADSLIVLTGKFTSADLYGVNRSNGGRLAAEGFWDNTAVNATNVASTSPLAKGNILIGDDLVISGGLLSSAGTTNSLNIVPDGFLELRNTEVTTTINMSPTSVLLLGTQDETGVATAPVVLNNANINMGGDSFLLVESDPSGVANLDGTATISSGHQGNLILAARRVFDPLSVSIVPDVMALNVGSGIRLNVTGNQSSLPAGLAFYYSQLGITAPPDRPVFSVGQLTPEAVGIAEYEDYDGFSTPITTVLTGFADPSFVIDGTPDPLTQGSLICSVNDICVKFDVAQNLNYSGMVMSTLGAPEPTLANSGVAFVTGADLSGVQFAVQTPTSIKYMSGVNIVKFADLVSGKSLVNGPTSTVRFGSNLGNENISNNVENNGLFELQGNYTLSGLLTGTGTLSNSGNLVLGNGSGSLISNSIVNSGTITNAGSYTLASVISGAGAFANNGMLNLTGSGLFGNSILNSGTGVLNFAGGPGQSIQFGSGFSNASNVFFNGGLFGFSNGYSQAAGNLTVQPGTTLTGNVNINGGALRGFATVNGNVNAQSGRIIPGASPGLMTVNGDLNLDANSVIDIEIQSNGGVKGVDFDCIVVNGIANLAGQLNLIDISGGNLGAGNQYAFLEANSINGVFGSVSKLNTGLGYSFSDPLVGTLSSIQQLSTSTIAQASSGTIATGSTGTTSTSTINQNLDQAFTPPPSTTTTQSSSTSSSSTTTSTQEEEAVEVANQSTAGTTVSQQSNDIELQSTQSDPQRASAVCK